MAESESDKGAEDELAGGMAEAGKDRAKAGEGTRGEPGEGADPSKLTEGMSESGSGAPTRSESPHDNSGGTKP